MESQFSSARAATDLGGDDFEAVAFGVQAAKRGENDGCFLGRSALEMVRPGAGISMIIYGQLYHEYHEYALINVNHLDEFRWFTMPESGFNQQESGFNQQMNLGVHPKWKQMEHDGISCVFGETVKSIKITYP